MGQRFSRPRAPLAPFVLSSLAVIAAVVGVGGALHRGSDKSRGPSPLASLAAEDWDSGEIVVDFRDGTSKAQYDESEKRWGIDVEFNSVVGEEDGITVGRVDPARRDGLLAEIRKDPSVERAEPLFRYRASFVPNDPQFKAQWNFEQIGLREAWDVSQGAGVTIAVLDTGIAYEDHGEFRAVPDLRGVRFAQGYDFVNHDEHANDDHGHGTHVAGTLAQATDNREGVAGVAFKAILMPLKVLDQNGSGRSADIADAIRWAADHGARVLNLSLGGGGRSEVMEAAVAYARKKGAVVVCAAGNGARGQVEYPAAYPGAIAVSAVGPTGELASYSSFGKELDLAAPGGDQGLRGRDEDGVLQNTIDPRDPSRSVYAFFNGTSMATPHVAGAAALLFAAGAGSPDEVERALFEGADHARSGDWNDRYGHGLLNVAGSLQALGRAPGGPWWNKLVMLAFAFALWLLTRISLPRSVRRALRPGLGTLGALALAALGFFFLPWLGLGQVRGLAVLVRPIPEWGNAVFGGAAANPLFFSALLPLLLSMVGYRSPPLRGILAGLAVGFAAVLLARAFSGSAAVALLPPGLASILWLAVNAVFLLFLARAAMKSAGERA